MSLEYSTDGSHDFIPEDIRARTEPISRIALEAFYLQDCTDLRANIFSRLEKIGALHSGEGWMIYDFNTAESGSIAMADGREDVLVSVSTPADAPKMDGHRIPTIHILTNEAITGLNCEENYLTVDFTLDGYNDAQYLVDGVWVDHERAKLVTKHGALFIYDATENAVTVHNRPLEYFTPKFPVKTADGRVLPFGTYKCMEDKIHALSVATAILDETAQMEPIRSSQP